MKSFVLITTILFTTPDKDHTTVIMEEYPTQAFCESEKVNFPSVNVVGLVGIEVTQECVEKVE